jgi:hypothetical protein
MMMVGTRAGLGCTPATAAAVASAGFDGGSEAAFSAGAAGAVLAAEEGDAGCN